MNVDSIIRQLQGIRCPSPMWHHGEVISSCADGVAKSLKTFLNIESKPKTANQENKKTVILQSVKTITSHQTCPDCGSSIEHSEGCMKCNSCGWSKC